MLVTMEYYLLMFQLFDAQPMSGHRSVVKWYSLNVLEAVVLKFHRQNQNGLMTCGHEMNHMVNELLAATYMASGQGVVACQLLLQLMEM